MSIKGRSGDVKDIILGLSLDEGPGANIGANPANTAWGIRRRKQPLTQQPWMNVETPRGFVRSRRQPVRTFRTVNGKVPGRWDLEEMAIAEPYNIFRPESPRSSRLVALGPGSNRVTPIRQRHTPPRHHHSPRRHHHASPKHHHTKTKKSFLKKIWHRLINRKGGKKSKKSRKRHRRRKTRKN
jgi:hypothetical protein